MIDVYNFEFALLQYDCISAPFEKNGIPYSWWNDRNGNPQYFWAGASDDGIHICQCGIDKYCVDNSFRCNCDSGVGTPLTDNGELCLIGCFYYLTNCILF